MNIPLLNDILIIFGLAVAVLVICHRLRIPAILGYLLTGVVAGPHGLKLVHAIHEVELLAEVGVVLLLFTIGIEFSIKSLLEIKKIVLAGGSLQVGVTTICVWLWSKLYGLSWESALFMGWLVSLSSTAIILKLLQEKGQVETPHGNASLGILIFQDIIIVPMMLFTPILAGTAQNISATVLILLAKFFGIILIVILGARYIVPHLLFLVTKTRSRELFLLAMVSLCLGVAWLTSMAGLSLAFGAFLAGLIISESEYSHQAIGDILPFRDLFTSFFFVSIGMLLNISFVASNPFSLLTFTIGVLLVKALVTFISGKIIRLPFRTSLITALVLAQVGEFSFILSKVGMDVGLLTDSTYQLFLGVAVMTMALTPFIAGFSAKAADIAMGLPFLSARIASQPEDLPEEDPLRNHLIIVGFGLTGQKVAHAARIAGVLSVVIEMNPETVKREKAKGRNIHYGDPTHPDIFEQAGIRNAKVVVIAINDPAATRRITEIARSLSPGVHLIVRTRFQKEMQELYDLGANEVITEEIESAVEIFSRILSRYLIPKSEIEEFVKDMRKDREEMVRAIIPAPGAACSLEITLDDVEITPLKVASSSPIAGKTLGETAMRTKYDVTLLAVRRGKQTLPNPGADFMLLGEDRLILLGKPHNISRISDILQPPSPAP